MAATQPVLHLLGKLDAVADRLAVLRTFTSAACAAAVARDLDELEYTAPLIEGAAEEAIAAVRDLVAEAGGAQ